MSLYIHLDENVSEKPHGLIFIFKRYRYRVTRRPLSAAAVPVLVVLPDGSPLHHLLSPHETAGNFRDAMEAQYPVLPIGDISCGEHLLHVRVDVVCHTV